MKKMLFLAAIGMAGLMSAKTGDVKLVKESKEKPSETCGVTITYYDNEGHVSDVKTFYSADQPNLMSCVVWQRTMIAMNSNAGYVN